jgi:hypothetical protein
MPVISLPSPIGEALTERRQPGRAGHGRRDRHDVAAFGAVFDQCLGKGHRPARRCNGGGLSSLRIDHTALVHLLGLVGLGRGVAHSLAGGHMHDHRAAETAGPAQGGLDRAFVVTVDRADVLQPEIGEQQLRCQRILDARLDAVHEVIADLTDQRHRTHHVPAFFQHLLVGRLQPQHGQVVGDAADRGCVAAAVVVDDDDHRPTRGRDVVQRLPAHTAGQRAVSDHRDHMPVAVPGQLERLGQAVGVGQRRTGVAGLHPVVLAFGA